MGDIALAVWGGNPITSLLGAMVFPRDQSKAEVYAAHWSAKAVGHASPEAFAVTSTEHRYLHAIATRYAGIDAEARREAYRGTQSGALVAYLWHAGLDHPSWQDAVRAAEKVAGPKVAGTRSSLLAAKAHFSSVLHYWGILSLEYENKTPHDFCVFVAQSMQLLLVMRERESQHKLGGGAFTSDKIVVPWAAIDWRVDCKIGRGAVPDDLAPSSKKRAGRPPKMGVLK